MVYLINISNYYRKAKRVVAESEGRDESADEKGSADTSVDDGAEDKNTVEKKEDEEKAAAPPPK